MKIIFCLLLINCFLSGSSQDIAVQKLLYVRTINGAFVDHAEVWVLKDYMFRFNPKDTSESNFIDFKNQTSTINAFGRSHTSSTNDTTIFIKNALMELGKDTFLYASKPNTFTNQYGQKLSTTHDSIWFDKNSMISKNANGSFNGFLDNGLGYLPLKSVIIIQNHQTDQVSRVEFLLESRNNIILRKEWLLRYFYIE